MAVAPSCPDDKVLTQLTLDQVTPKHKASLVQHLRKCATCQARLEKLPNADTLLDLVRSETLSEGKGQEEPPSKPPSAKISVQDGQGLAQGAEEPLEESVSFLSPAKEPDEIGRMGGYRVLKTLGQGGMGAVFLAEDSQLRRTVALKVMLPEQAKKPEAKERFLREARAAAAIEHDNIVTIYQVGEEHGIPYIAMQLLKGASLDDWLRAREKKQAGPVLPVPQIVKIGREIARGLAAAHERGLIHRDIKLANIWLDSSQGGRVKILDFGLARPANPEQGAAESQITQSGTILGTPAYMAPEQARGEKVDGRADLFSLGCVLYRLCTSAMPFKGPDMMSTLLAIATQTPTPPRQLNPNIPEPLSDLVMKLLEKDAAKRIANAGDVAKALTAIDKGAKELPPLRVEGPAGASKDPTPPPIVHPAKDQKGPTGDESIQLLPVRRRKRQTAGWWPPDRKLALVIGGGVLGLALFTFGLIWLLTGGKAALRAEFADAEMELRVKGTAIVLKKGGKEEVELEPGEYTLVASRGPANVETSKINVAAGDVVTIRVEVVQGKLIVKHNARVLGETALASAPRPPLTTAPTATTAPAKPTVPATKPPPVTTAPVKPVKPPAHAVAPFDAPAAKKYQNAWAGYLKVKANHLNTINMSFMLIPPGQFTMGLTKEQLDQLIKMHPDAAQHGRYRVSTPDHLVTLTKPIFMGTVEVTQEQFNKVMGKNPSTFRRGGINEKYLEKGNPDVFPVDNVTWFEAVEFCNKLSELEKLTPRYKIEGDKVTRIDGTGYRLPTEAEWEYAARAGSPKLFWFGDPSEEDQRAARDLISPFTSWSYNGGMSEVGKKQPNPFGLRDVLGNVSEYCEDLYAANTYAFGSQTDPVGPQVGGQRIVRGCNYTCNNPFDAALAARLPAVNPKQGTPQHGFRIVLDVKLP
jgi:serine/threonine protein kinase/formylglycine-generating enzyme required for sulfatase activity